MALNLINRMTSLSLHRPGLFLIASVLLLTPSAHAAKPTTAAVRAASCEAAFEESSPDAVHAPLTTNEQSFEYLRQVNGGQDFSDADLAEMSKLSQLFGTKPATLFARAKEVFRLANAELALTVNTREVIRDAVLSLRSTTDQLRENLGTIVVMVKPVGFGGRRLMVPNRIHLRLAALAILTGENPGEIAFRFNDNFKAVVNQPPASADDLLFAKSPLDVALGLTIAESEISNPNAAMVAAE